MYGQPPIPSMASYQTETVADHWKAENLHTPIKQAANKSRKHSNPWTIIITSILNLYIDTCMDKFANCNGEATS
jgi:hypothetical protein